MNYTVLSAVIDELALLLPGAIVERVLGSTGNNILFELNQGRKRLHLLLSPDRELPRLHLVSEKPATTPLSQSFALFLKSRVTGGRVAGIRLLNEDRVVEVVFRRRDAQFHLFFELVGRTANLLLIDQAGVILSVLYPVAVTGNNTRLLLPGVRYEAPRKRIQPDRTGKPPDVQPEGTEACANLTAELEFERVLSGRRFAAAAARLGTALRKAQERTGRRRDSLVQDLVRCDQASEYKQAGDLILANLQQLRSGMSAAELTGHDGVSRMVSLDPKRTPVQNAEQYFKRYKKAKAGRSIVSQRLDAAEEALAFLADLRSSLEKACDEAELTGIASKLEETGYLKTSTKEQPRGAAKTAFQPLPVRRIQFRGWEIVVGKSAAGNDYISTKLARAADLWFHADGIPGSHVIIRNPEHREVPAEIVAKAASLAAYHSKGRSAGKVAVTFTLSQNVKKPKGAKAGLVTVSERRTIMAVPSEE